MKRLLLLFFAFTILINTVFAQKKLTNSRTVGYYTYIYKITDKETFRITSESSSMINDSFLHTKIDSFYNDNPILEPKLPYGNYLYVKAIDGLLDYRLVPVKNVRLGFVNNGKDFQFFISDLNGDHIKDAIVRLGKHKIIRYDPIAGLYHTGKDADQKVITVTYKGVNNYFIYDDEKYNREDERPFFTKIVHSSPLKYTWMPFKRVFNPVKVKKEKYKGYMVFNKPKYKPLDTVKFKAYLVSASGKDIYDKPLSVTLKVNSDNKFEKLISSALRPYRAGGYEYSFVLADSLGMTLDKFYYVSLSEKYKKSWNALMSASFKYEDYELKSIQFNTRTDKEVHHPGNPITVFFKATDENDLPVPDGRVELIVIPNSVVRYDDQKLFVKDTLWKKNIVLDPVGETKFVLPDSIFPKADLKFFLQMNFLNSNNESQKATKYLQYVVKTEEFKGELKKDSIHLEYLVKGISAPKRTRLYTETFKNYIDSADVQLPLVLKIDQRIKEYRIKSADGFQGVVYLSDLKPIAGIDIVQKKDSLAISVGNESKISFWYTVFSGDKVRLRGYTNKLDTVIKQSSGKASHLHLSYMWAGEERTEESSSVYNHKRLNVTLISPGVVYPGETVNMEVKVTDHNNQPAKSTDVTAYSNTAKFTDKSTVDLPDFGKRYYNRKKRKEIELDYTDPFSKRPINWERWGRALGLDTIEYYKFTQTKDVYSITEDSKDTMTVVAPFVVNNGRIEPVSIVYIDDVPVYFSKSDQLQHYAFKITPGKHSIKLRTSDHLVVLNDYYFVKGKKTIVSVAVDLLNAKARVSKVPKELDVAESAFLTKFMITVANNFKDVKATIATNSRVVLLNPQGINSRRLDFLVGPFADNMLSFKSDSINQTFLKEPGYTYTFLPGLLKQKSYVSKYGFNQTLVNSFMQNNDNYKQFPLEESDLDKFWDDYLNLRNSTVQLFYYPDYNVPGYGQLIMNLDTSISNHMPFLKNIVIYKHDQADLIQVYAGNVTRFNALENGKYQVLYLFKDNRYFVAKDVLINPKGTNYFNWKAMKIQPADSISIKIDQAVKSARRNDAWTISADEDLMVKEKLNSFFFDRSMLVNKMSGRVTNDKGAGISSVSVKVKGLATSVITGADGKFEIKVPEKGFIHISSPGYVSLDIPVRKGNAGDLILIPDSSVLEGIVVVGYGIQKKTLVTSSIVQESLSGKVMGLSVYKLVLRGNSLNQGQEKPLIIVDGLPFNGDLSTLHPDDIIETNILNASEAMKYYGSAAINGAFVITTKAGNVLSKTNAEPVSQESTIRRNFSDYAIWQPKLITDDQGKASFSVRFPDDITSWRTNVVAMNGRRQSGLSVSNIKSFKVLSANFVSPQFALVGDRMNVIGKLMNYNPKEESVTRIFKYNDSTRLNSVVKFKNAQIDTMSILAAGKEGDSLKFEYTMKAANNYFDGEIRKIPLLTAGVLETKGYFNALIRDTTISYSFDPNLGKVSLRAEASVFPTLLDEIDKLRRYEYLCNEQLASKLKALLLEKTVRKYLGDSFKEEKNIRELVKQLQQNQRMEGTWGWWKNSDEENWISLHVVEALLLAEKQGYPIALKKDKLYNYLVAKLGSGHRTFDQVHAIKLLYLLNEKYEFKDWILEIEKERLAHVKTAGTQPLYEKLQLMALKQKAGLKIDVQALLTQKKETMFGNIYWGEQSNRFWDNSIQNTLLAYQILKNAGGHRSELEAIQRYFLEQRKDGQWRNTYESSLILETILPELLVKSKDAEPASITLNKTEKISVFPYQKVVDPQLLNVEKKGGAPVYFTAYQQFNNPDPKKVSKDFTVKTWFEQGGNTVQKLKAGALTTLKVEVDVRADADYVMVEVPIPAGVSYENKLQNFWGVESHREYFKHKTSIFCAKLKKGKYIFNIDVMPRYSGEYLLNPAKAEMMYFPAFFGREGMKRVEIK